MVAATIAATYWRVAASMASALLLAATAAAADKPTPEAPRHALVIGHTRYAEVSSLPSVANDLTDVCQSLKALRFTATCVADLPDRGALLHTVERFVAGVPAGAHMVFYYAGHAVQVSGENYLIPSGVSTRDARGWLPQFVGLSELFALTERARAGFQFIVLDACRDNPEAPRPVAAASGADTLRSLLGSMRRGGHFASYGVSAVRDAPANTLVLFATGAGTSAFDGNGERNGPLTKQLLVEMQRPQVQLDQAVKRIIQSVGDDTERRYRQRQSPSVYGTFAGEFCFNGCPPSAEQLRQEQAREQRERERLRRDSVVVPTL
jgi:uncharacterized caspase-like protein